MAKNNEGVVLAKHLGGGFSFDDTQKKINVDLDDLIDHSTLGYNSYGLLSVNTFKQFGVIPVSYLHNMRVDPAHGFDESTRLSNSNFHAGMIGFEGVAYIHAEMPRNILAAEVGFNDGSDLDPDKVSSGNVRDVVNVGIKLESFIKDRLNHPSNGSISNTTDDYTGTYGVIGHVTQTIYFLDKDKKQRIFTRELKFVRDSDAYGSSLDEPKVASIELPKNYTSKDPWGPKKRMFIVWGELDRSDWRDWVELSNVEYVSVAPAEYTASNGVKLVGNDIQLDLDERLGKGFKSDDSTGKINVDLQPFVDNSTIDFNEFGLLSATNIKHFRRVQVQDLHAFTPVADSYAADEAEKFHTAMEGFRGIAYINAYVSENFFKQEFGVNPHPRITTNYNSFDSVVVNVKIEEFIAPGAISSDDGNLSNVSANGDGGGLDGYEIIVSQTISFEDENDNLRIFTRKLNPKTNSKSFNPKNRVATITLDQDKYGYTNSGYNGNERTRKYIVWKDLTKDDWYDWEEITNVADASITTPPSTTEVTASNGLEKVGNDVRAKVDNVSIKVNTQGQLHTDIYSTINQYPIKTDYVYETYAIVQQGDELYRMPLTPSSINSGDIVIFDSGWWEIEADTVDHPQKAARVWSTSNGNIRRIRVGDKIRIKGRVKNITLNSADFLATIKVSNPGNTRHGSGNNVDLATVLSFDWNTLAKSGNAPQGTTITREGDKIKVTGVPRGESAYFTIDATVNTFPASKRIQINTDVEFTGNYAVDPAWNTRIKYGRTIGCYAYLDGFYDTDEYLGDADWISMLGFDSNRVTLRRNGTYPPAENWFSKKPANIKSYSYNGNPPALTSDSVDINFVVTCQDNSTFTFTTSGKQVIS